MYVESDGRLTLVKAPFCLLVVVEAMMYLEVYAGKFRGEVFRNMLK